MPTKNKRKIDHTDGNKVKVSLQCKEEGTSKMRYLANYADTMLSAAFLNNNNNKSLKRMRVDDAVTNDDKICCEVDEDTTLEELGRRAFYTTVRPRIWPESFFLPSAAGKQDDIGESASLVNVPAASFLASTPHHANTEGAKALQGNACGTTNVLQKDAYNFTGGVESLLNNEQGVFCGLQSGGAGPVNRDFADPSHSPPERSSAALIRRVVAARPAASPETMWICIDDDDDEEGEVKVMSHQSSLPLTASSSATNVLFPTMFRAPPPQRGCVCHQVGHEPIAELLPPTFFPRKRNKQTQKSLILPITPLQSRGLIHDDDITESEREEEWESRDDGSETRKIVSSSSSSIFSVEQIKRHESSCLSMINKTNFSRILSSYSIIDDDNSISSSRGSSKGHIGQNDDSAMCEEQTDGYHGIEVAKEFLKAEDTDISNTKRSPRSSLFIDETASCMLNDTVAESSAQNVRDVIYFSRRRSLNDCVNMSHSSFSGFSTVKCEDGKKNMDTDSSLKKLKQLFGRRTSRRSFFSAVESILPKPHCLQSGEFWDAFTSVNYVGEGSFGIVWRCETADGDVVAVKSCPISLRSCGSVEDAFSVLREIAVMRFLNEHEVPYILPLYSAFFVEASEALPPDVLAAVKWKEKVAREEEEEEEERRKKEEEKKADLRSKRLNKAGLRCLINKEGSPKHDEGTVNSGNTAQQSRYDAIQLPRFFSISSEDAMWSDLTVFLVTEICDGDVENIERHDTIMKGVAFSVTSALSEMHRLGILHLDIKPSNILFAYENGFSQISQHQRQEEKQPENLSPSFHLDDCRMDDPTGSLLTLKSVVASKTGIYKAGSVKFYLTDFGNCRIVGPGKMDKVRNVFGTFEYMDSMALQYKTCSRATDCFGLGATLYELLYSKRLYPPCTNPECDSEEDHTRHCYIEASLRPVVPQTLPYPSPSAMFLQKITMGLLEQDPKKRWTAEQCRSLFLVNDIAKVLATVSS